MGILRVGLLALLAFPIQSATASNPALTSLVERMFRFPGVMFGEDVHELWGAGDAAALAAVRCLDVEKPISEGSADVLVDIITAAFAGPAVIQAPADRNPAVSLVTLRLLAGGRYSRALKARVAEATRMLIAIRKAQVGPADGHD